MTINEFITTYQSEIIISLITGIFTAFAVWILTYKVLIARIKCSKVILKENDGVYRFTAKKRASPLCVAGFAISITESDFFFGLYRFFKILL